MGDSKEDTVKEKISNYEDCVGEFALDKARQELKKKKKDGRMRNFNIKYLRY